jgi:hypothetical protein
MCMYANPHTFPEGCKSVKYQYVSFAYQGGVKRYHPSEPVHHSTAHTTTTMGRYHTPPITLPHMSYNTATANLPSYNCAFSTLHHPGDNIAPHIGKCTTKGHGPVHLSPVCVGTNLRQTLKKKLPNDCTDFYAASPHQKLMLR